MALWIYYLNDLIIFSKDTEFCALCTCTTYMSSDSSFLSLSVPVLNMLLNELLCISKVPPGTKHVDMDLATLPPTTAMAILLYNRW